jgi:hypothetical protein
MGPSYRTTWAALAAALSILIYFVLEKWLGYDLPADVEGAIGAVVAAAIGAIGVFARDNRVSSEDAGIKDRVVGDVVEGSAIRLAQPVEIVEPSTDAKDAQ